jgi:para-aminobenzoate synthetase component 1
MVSLDAIIRPRRQFASRAAHVRPIAYRDPLDAFAPFADAPMSLLLHGCGEHPQARWSYLLTEPADVFELRTPGAEGLAELQRWMRRQGRALNSPVGAFCGGVAGLFSYEFGASLDDAAPQTAPERLPLVALANYTRVVAFDHLAQEAFLVSASEAGADDFAERLGVQPFAPPQAAGSVAALDSAETYADHVRHLITRIHAGDLYQANLSRRFQGALGAGDHPYALFARLCRQSPAPFCSYLRLPDAAIVSNSPERFVSVRKTEQGMMVRTSPIKGTRPRGSNVEEDARHIAELLDSEKDRAENLMIVDLMRNDISRVCAPGSVRAPKLFAAETFANVHHLVSTVEGRLAPGRDAFDLMRAVFPAGSITGAPKWKAMHMIESAERAPREANYGAMAWFGCDGAMDSSVLIRTATCFQTEQGWDVGFRVGAGIVADSEPEEETRETEIKAKSLMRAIVGPCQVP